MVNENIEEKPQNGGKVVERDKEGKFVEGHTKLGGAEKGKSYSLITILKRKLAEKIKKEGKEAGEELVDLWLEKAKTEKEFNALKEIIRYIDGMPKQNLTLGVDETIGEVKITIKKNEDSKPASDNDISEELGAVSEEGETNNS